MISPRESNGPVQRFAWLLIAEIERNERGMLEAYERTDTHSDLADSLMWRQLAIVVRRALAEFEAR